MFKDEIADAQLFIGLNAKCYIAKQNTETKVSCKGVNQRQNLLTTDMYRETLFGDKGQFKTRQVSNTAFRKIGPEIMTYIHAANDWTESFLHEA